MDQPQDLVNVQSFMTVEEAHVFKNFLEAEGIRAYLSDENTVGYFWHMNNALGGIKVQVAEADAERVKQLLEEDRSQAVEAGADPGLTEEESDCLTEGDPEAKLEPAQGVSIAPETDAAEPAGAGRRRSAGALQAAVLGIFACPPLLHFYSLWVLIRLDGELSPKGKFHMSAAFVIDMLALLMIGSMLLFYGTW